MLRSMVCRHEHFTQPWYPRWARRLNLPLVVSPLQPISYRKAWEWAAILQALDERGVVGHGRRGMGFAVGREPLASVFASLGTEIVASDMPLDHADGGWVQTGQHAASLEALFHANQVDRDRFEKLVSFRPVDMTRVHELEAGPFDFVWSSCAFEHLGNLERGLDFVVNAMRLLKPGGVAAHTTEFNVVSNDETITEGPDCIYRKRDLEALDYRLRRIRCGLVSPDFESGSHQYDLDYDVPPLFEVGKVCIKFELSGYVCTSFLVIAVKAGGQYEEPR